MSNQHSDICVLAGDIGGTKTNLGLFRLVEDRPALQVMETYAGKEAFGLEQLIARFKDSHPEPFDSACFGIAGPVMDGRGKTTNLPWVVSEDSIKTTFNIKQVRLLNDLAATAKSIPALNNTELHELNNGQADPKGAIGLIAPGTGLGTALLLCSEGRRIPLASEGGHADFAPRNSLEIELLRHLLKSTDHVSVERTASGPGIFTIYSWLKEYRRHSEPDWLAVRLCEEDPSKVVSEAALNEGEPLCVETLDMFVSIIGAVAGNLALTGITTGGMYIGGGIAPRILSKLSDGCFVEAFTAKGRFREMLVNMPVHVILNDKAALLGAACCAMEIADR